MVEEKDHHPLCVKCLKRFHDKVEFQAHKRTGCTGVGAGA